MYPLLLLLLLASGAAAQGAERAGVEGSGRRSDSSPYANPRGATQRTFRTTGDGTAIQSVRTRNLLLLAARSSSRHQQL
jgi:hypothetical protein